MISCLVDKVAWELGGVVVSWEWEKLAMEGPGESQQTGGETIGSGVSRRKTRVCVCIKKGGLTTGDHGTPGQMPVTSMCRCAWVKESWYQQLQWGCSLGSLHTQVPPTVNLGSKGSCWPDWVFEPSYQRDLHCTYIHTFLLTDLHPSQPERWTGWGHCCCLCSCECSAWPPAISLSRYCIPVCLSL